VKYTWNQGDTPGISQVIQGFAEKKPITENINPKEGKKVSFIVKFCNVGVKIKKEDDFAGIDHDEMILCVIFSV
jgi:hypothetical protein